MKKNNKKINSLIKRKNLILRLKMHGIRRANPDSVNFIENALEEILGRLFSGTSEKMQIHGRKEKKKEDVKNVLEKIKKKEDSWEI